jgi:hypothetical protein
MDSIGEDYDYVDLDKKDGKVTGEQKDGIE